MNTSMMELNLNELEAVNGGFDFKRFISHFETEDVLIAVLGGPIGQGLFLAEVVAGVAAEIATDD